MLVRRGARLWKTRTCVIAMLASASIIPLKNLANELFLRQG